MLERVTSVVPGGRVPESGRQSSSLPVSTARLSGLKASGSAGQLLVGERLTDQGQGRGVPDPGGFIVAAGDRVPPVGAEGHGQHLAAVLEEDPGGGRSRWPRAGPCRRRCR